MVKDYILQRDLLYEYAVELLARGHSKETGQIRIKMESQASNVLSEGIFCLDARQAEPVASTLLKGSLRALRLLPRIRSAQERNALNGQYPSSADIREMPPRVPGASPEEGSTAISTLPLFSQEE